MTSCSSLQNFLPVPTALETALALKDILNSSSFKAIKTLSKMSNGGGPAALLPDELQPVLSTLKTLGLGEDVDKITRQIGNASAIAAEESALIMKDAISQVKFKDAANIVLTGGDAATSVLKNAMYGTVKKRYVSKLDDELGKTEALQYWGPAKAAYNLFSKEKVEGGMSDFIAERAVDAIFLGMGVEEKKTRVNYQKLGSTVVNKVFDYYSKQKNYNKGS